MAYRVLRFFQDEIDKRDRRLATLESDCDALRQTNSNLQVTIAKMDKPNPITFALGSFTFTAGVGIIFLVQIWIGIVIALLGLFVSLASYYWKP